MENKNKPKSRQVNMVIQELEGEVLIYDLDKNKAFCLNQTSALVWQSCDGTRTIADIGSIVGKQLNSQVSEDIVWLAIDQLSKENLIENRTELNNKFGGLSRREVIRKIGLASVISLPLVTSLIAPLAIHAASTCIPVTGGCTCPGNGTNGTICANGTGCLSNCQCQRNSNGGAGNGSCVP